MTMLVTLGLVAVMVVAISGEDTEISGSDDDLSGYCPALQSCLDQIKDTPVGADVVKIISKIKKFDLSRLLAAVSESLDMLPDKPMDALMNIVDSFSKSDNQGSGTVGGKNKKSGSSFFGSLLDGLFAKGDQSPTGILGSLAKSFFGGGQKEGKEGRRKNRQKDEDERDDGSRKHSWRN